MVKKIQHQKDLINHQALLISRYQSIYRCNPFLTVY